MGTKIGPDCPGSVLAGGSDFTRSQRSSSETRQARHLAPDDGTRLPTTTANQPSLPSTVSSRSSILTQRTCASSCSSSSEGRIDCTRLASASTASQVIPAGLPRATKLALGITLSSGTPGSSVYSPSSNTNRAIHGRGYPGASCLPPEGAGSGPPGLAASSLRSHGSARRLSTTCARLSENGPWPLRGG